VKPIGEFNDIKVNIVEYTNVIDDRFDIFIDSNIDSLLVLVDGIEDWFSVFLIRGIYVSALVTVSIENRIARVLPREGVESDFNIFFFLSRKHDDDRPGVLYYSSDIYSWAFLRYSSLFGRTVYWLYKGSVEVFPTK